ncbi:hypothetical protein [Sphingomonas sp. 1185]|uniref:hypothetical protein n=1 Tax=Sphingomonas sp. 1185 TaxID=3156411 RepID=UPI003393EBBF
MKIIVAGLLASVAPITAAAQEAAPQAGTEQAEPGDEIVVTGTRTGERTVTTSPVPIDVLRGDELRASPVRHAATSN